MQTRVDARSGPVTVCFPFAGSRVGGSHISAIKLIQALDPDRYRPLVLIHQRGGEVEQLFADYNVLREPAPLGPSEGELAALRSLTRAPALAKFLRSRNVKIVHTNDGESHFVWALPTRLAGAKMVWHHRANPSGRGLRFIAPWAADQVVSVSRFASPRPGLWSAAGKNVVVPSPFDTDYSDIDRDAAHRAACAELGVPTETKLIGFVGNLVPRKRPLAFVETIAAIRKQAPNVPVLGLFFGRAKFDLDRKAMELAQSLGVADCVKLMGFRFPAEPWLAACDVFLVPAIEEPFGRSIIEGMLIRTPVVATSSGGNVEAIEDGRTGFLVPVDGTELMATRTIELLTKPELHQRITAQARADAEQRFGVARHANAIMDIYERLLGRANEPDTSRAAVAGGRA